MIIVVATVFHLGKVVNTTTDIEVQNALAHAPEPIQPIPSTGYLVHYTHEKLFQHIIGPCG